MLAIVAAVCFALAAFGVDPSGVDLLLLGLAFLAGHFAWPVGVPPGRVGR